MGAWFGSREVHDGTCGRDRRCFEDSLRPHCHEPGVEEQFDDCLGRLGEPAGEGAVEDHQRPGPHVVGLTQWNVGDDAAVVQETAFVLHRRPNSGDGRARQECGEKPPFSNQIGSGGGDVHGDRGERHLEVGEGLVFTEEVGDDGCEPFVGKGLVRRRVRAWSSGPPGRMCSRFIFGQACDSRLAAPFGSSARIAPLIEPMDVPATRSEAAACSPKACSMPTWTALRRPPPPSTNPTGVANLLCPSDPPHSVSRDGPRCEGRRRRLASFQISVAQRTLLAIAAHSSHSEPVSGLVSKAALRNGT